MSFNCFVFLPPFFTYFVQQNAGFGTPERWSSKTACNLQNLRIGRIYELFLKIHEVYDQLGLLSC